MKKEKYVGTEDQNRRIAGVAFWMAAIGASMMIAATASIAGVVAACGVAGACLFLFGLVAGFLFDGK